MSAEGISMGGGLEGIGGGEPKVTKGVSGVGDAAQSDIDKFNFKLSEGGGEAAKGGKIDINIAERLSGQKGPNGPFDFQTNRVRDSDIAKTEKPGMGRIVVEETQKMVSLGRNQEERIMAKIGEAGENGWDTGTMMEIQFEMGQYTALIDVVSKGAGKAVQAVQTVIKQQ